MKYLKKTCAITLSAAMVLGLAAGNGNISYAAGNVEKEETVYINQETDGTVSSITVSDWLKNVTEKGEILDTSKLSDIKNVKGNEVFKEGSNGELTWEAEGEDIYYQGTSNEELPVGVKITYKLDGVAIAPSQLAGKSGKLTITIHYENNAVYEDKINGKTIRMNTPFLMASALILPVDNFENIEISQGKMISEGSNQILVAYGMPGLSDSLDLSEDIKKDLEESLSDTVTITADVKDVSINSIYTVATSDVFSDIDLDTSGDVNDLDDAINGLVDATDELISGSDELSDGLTTLQTNFKTYAGGVDSVSKGATDLSSGAGKLAKGVSQYTAGVKTLTDGASAYVNGTNTLAAGVSAYVDGEKLVAEGVTTLKNKTAEFPGLYGQFSTGLNEYVAGVNQIANPQNTKALKDGASAVKSGISSVNEGLSGLQSYYQSVISELKGIDKSGMTEDQVKKIDAVVGELEALTDGDSNSIKAVIGSTSQGSNLYKGSAQIADAMSQLNDNAQKLSDGGSTLLTYDAQLKAGINDLGAGITDLYNGVTELSKNNDTLVEGAKTLTSSGINLTSGISELTKSTQTLTSSANQLSKGAGKLSKGATSLDSATDEVSDGVNKLQSGSIDLVKGLNTFKSDGTGKLQSKYNNNIKTILERFESLTADAANYKSYSGIKDGMSGSVKFVFQTEGISSDKE